MATISFSVCFSAATTTRGQLLFVGGVYFIGKLADSKDSRIRYMRAIQLGHINAGSSTHSLSVLLSAMEMSLRTQTALEIAQ